MQQALFESELIRLTAIDLEKDAETLAQWSHFGEFVRAMGAEPVRPLSKAVVKKNIEELEKQVDESRNLFHFAVRTRADERLVGIAVLDWIGWTHGTARLQVGIADPAERGKGYGTQTVHLMLQYAFRELNLHRLTVQLPEYNQAGQRFCQRFGFKPEVRRRQAIHREGRHWDIIHLGLLQHEWCGNSENQIVKKG